MHFVSATPAVQPLLTMLFFLPTATSLDAFLFDPVIVLFQDTGWDRLWHAAEFLFVCLFVLI